MKEAQNQHDLVTDIQDLLLGCDPCQADGQQKPQVILKACRESQSHSIEQCQHANVSHYQQHEYHSEDCEVESSKQRQTCNHLLQRANVADHRLHKLSYIVNQTED